MGGPALPDLFFRNVTLWGVLATCSEVAPQLPFYSIDTAFDTLTVTHTRGSAEGIWDTGPALRHVKPRDTEFMDRPRRNELISRCCVSGCGPFKDDVKDLE